MGGTWGPRVRLCPAVSIPESEGSKVVDWQVEDSKPVAHVVRSHPVGEYVKWMGDADRMPNGNTVVSMSMHDRVIELDAAGPPTTPCAAPHAWAF